MSKDNKENRETNKINGKEEEEFEDGLQGSGDQPDLLGETHGVVEGRSRFRGGVSRRGQNKGHHLAMNKVIVTAHSRPGQMLDDSIAMDRNLPPPRLPDTPNGQNAPQSTYLVNYPGAKLRVGAPIPSHLSPGSMVQSNRRENPPQSINFGSSSYSTGAFHQPRDSNLQEYRPQGQLRPPPPPPPPKPGHGIPREPVTYYNPRHPQPQNPPRFQFPGNRRPQQRPQPTQINNQNNNDNNHPPNVRVHNFKPSKLLPPLTKAPVIPPAKTTETLSTSSSSSSEGRPRLPVQSRPSKDNNLNGNGIKAATDHSIPSSSPASPKRRGQVVNAPRPALIGMGQDPPKDSTASLAPLGTISKSGVRPDIDHRTGSSSGALDPSSVGHQLWPPHQGRPGRRPAGIGYKRQDDGSYTFTSGEVYTPPPLIKRPVVNRTSKKPGMRITTRRPGNELPIIPYQETASTFVPKYVKEAIAEVEFESKTFEAPHPPSTSVYHERPNWFLMPVQGWFVLSIILAALLIVLGVVCIILYNSLRNQKRKVRKLLTPSLALATCTDPVNHDLCQCRTLAPLVRSHTLMSRASVMSRTSRLSPRPASRRQGVITYDNESQQRTTEFRSLPNPAIMDREKDNNLDSITTTHTQIEMEDTPPPLAPKKSSLTGATNHDVRSSVDNDTRGANDEGRPESRIGPAGGRDSRAGNDTRTLARRGGLRENRLGLPEGRSSSSLGGYMGSSYGGKGTSTQHQRSTTYHNPDVQLTTIYPPPRRFEL